jgi:hypothetical protein
MQTPPLFILWRPSFERNGIANSRGKMLIVQPAHSLLVGLQANSNAVISRAGLAFIFTGITISESTSTRNYAWRVLTYAISRNHF